MAALMAASSLIVGALFVARIQKRDFALLYFSLGTGIYAARLFLQAAHLAEGMLDLVLTTLLPIPLVLLMVEVAAREWRKAAWWIVGVNLLSATAAISARMLLARPALPWRMNNIFILLSVPLYVAMMFFPPRPPSRELNVLRAGLLVFLLFVIYTNLHWLGLVPGPGSIEYVGFTFLLGCLGYVALAQAQHKEEQLLALHKELEIARNIQAHLLPQANSTADNLRVASCYVPAAAVAGDFYDFLPFGGGLGVLIADVSGHGIPAALSASMVKVAVRAQMERAFDPAGVLREMNVVLCGNLQSQFVSAAYLFLEPGRRRLIYAGAGHPPLLVWRAGSRQIESMEENGLLLGILPESSYTARTAPLGPGDRCLLYTDGLLEATCPSGEEFGLQRLQDFMVENASLCAQPFCDALVREINEWSGRPQRPQDDVTIVAVDVPVRPISRVT